MIVMKWIVVVCLCLVITSAGAEDYEVAVTSVNIWVKVLDSSGTPVKGLTQADFQIFEDNKQVETTCFEESAFELARSEVPLKRTSEIPKKFVLFLDLYNTTDVEFKMVRPALQEFLRKLNGTNSEMMLAALLASGKLGVVSTFTPDLDRIRRLIDQAKGNFARDQRVRANDKELAELLTLAQPKQQERGPDRSGSGGEVPEATVSTNPDTDMREIAIKNAYRLAQIYYMEEKRMTEYSLAAMDAFTEDLSSRRLDVDEHAVVLFISGGFNFNPGRHYFDMIENVESKDSSANDIVKFATSNPGSRKQASQDTQRSLKKSIGKLNKANLTVYAVNTRGMFVPGGDASNRTMETAFHDPALLQDFQDSLIQIANETGGLSFSNSQNFPVGFQRILEDLSHQYVLCFNPSGKKKTDEYHEIKVVCKRPGVKLRHRLGYYR